MNRAELIGQIAELTGQTKTEVGGTITAIIHSITGAMSKGDKVTLVGFGTFERRNRQARTGRNPRTMAPLKIASAKVPAFRAGSELKEVIDGKVKQRSFAKVGTTAAKKAVAKKAVAKKPAQKAAKSKKR
jgi:DNA-binding protein HU-beta